MTVFFIMAAAAWYSGMLVMFKVTNVARQMDLMLDGHYRNGPSNGELIMLYLLSPVIFGVWAVGSVVVFVGERVINGLGWVLRPLKKEKV